MHVQSLMLPLNATAFRCGLSIVRNPHYINHCCLWVRPEDTFDGIPIMHQGTGKCLISLPLPTHRLLCNLRIMVSFKMNMGSVVGKSSYYEKVENKRNSNLIKDIYPKHGRGVPSKGSPVKNVTCSHLNDRDETMVMQTAL